MCGIAGIFDVRGKRAIDRPVLDAMTRSQAHRGPDDSGLHLEPGLGLGHRRLSILDLSTAGHQPMESDDGRLITVYNGEIYNFMEIRAVLEQLGHRFRTSCDTEVVLKAWEQWGSQAVERFRGMFAFAIWERERQKLTLVRDRLGIKPLYYAFLPNGVLLFGSELKALMRNPMLATDLDPCAVEEYFAFGYVPEPRTIFRCASKLPPGFMLAVKRGDRDVQPVPYWDVRFENGSATDETAVGEELIRRARDAVQLRMISDVPFGAFLSGGVDSSCVVALMAEASAVPVTTCSISFGDPKFNESRFAQKVAEQYQTAHHQKQVDPDDFDLVDRLTTIYDEPYADSSAIPTYRLCALAREHVTVALSGDGGDENFAGYRRYRWHMYEEIMRAMVPARIRRPVFKALGTVYPKADWAPKFLRAKTTLLGCAWDSVEGYFHTVSVVADSQRDRLFSAAFRRELQGYHAMEVFRAHAENAQTDEPLSLVQYLDLKTYLPGDILTKVDRASMAHSLEVRVPLLDHELVEWAARLPPSLKLRRREGKYILKKALESRLPHDVLYRPKMGFAVPLARWFRGPLAERVRKGVLESHLADSGIFDMGSLRRMVDAHGSGVNDYSGPLWSLLMFEAFLRKLDGQVQQAA